MPGWGPDRRFGRSSCLNEMSLRSYSRLQPRTSASPRSATRCARPGHRGCLRVGVAAAVSAGSADRRRGRGGPRPRPDRGGRRSIGPRPRRRPERLPRAAPRPHVSVPWNDLRVASRSTAAPGGPGIAAMNALGSTGRPIVVASAIALAEKSPIRRSAPRASPSTPARASISMTLRSCSRTRATTASTRSRRGQFAVRGGILDVCRRPRSRRSALSCSATRSSRCAASRSSPSGR